MERLTVSTRRTDDCPVVEVTGELDIATADLLDLHLHDVITRHGPARIVLDLSGLTFCDASGLRVLVAPTTPPDGATAGCTWCVRTV